MSEIDTLTVRAAVNPWIGGGGWDVVDGGGEIIRAGFATYDAALKWTEKYRAALLRPLPCEETGSPRKSLPE